MGDLLGCGAVDQGGQHVGLALGEVVEQHDVTRGGVDRRRLAVAEKGVGIDGDDPGEAGLAQGHGQ